MKNTNKKTLILGIVAVVLVFGIGGAMIGLLANSLKDASDKLDDAFGDLQGAETSPSEDSNTEDSNTEDSNTEDSNTEDSNTEDSSTETVPSDDTKLTYAEGEVYVGGRQNSLMGHTGYSFYCSSLKANTKYKISWSIKSTYGSYGFYFRYNDYDGVSTPFAVFSLLPTFSTNKEIIPVKPYESFMINNSYEFTTDSNGYVEIMLLFSDDLTLDAVSSQVRAFESLINYVEIEEVV